MEFFSTEDLEDDGCVGNVWIRGKRVFVNAVVSKEELDKNWIGL